MSRLIELGNHCIGSAESEYSFLQDAYVLENTYSDVLASPFGSPCILVGKKGTGKTALLTYIKEMHSKGGVDCLFLRPDDIPLGEFLDSAARDSSTNKQAAFKALINVIAIRIGAKLKGLLGKKDKKLFDKAVEAGAQDRDNVQVLLGALKKLGSVATPYDIEKLMPRNQVENTEGLLRVLRSNFDSAKHPYILLLDDIDQVVSGAGEAHINRIWGLLLAVRKLTNTIPNIKAVVTLRTEVWRQLKTARNGQRDQIDHFRPLVKLLDPSDDQIKEILIRRLALVSGKLGLNTSGERVVENFFSSSSVRLPGSGDEYRHWIDFLSKSSRGRPRDALQLIHSLCKVNRARDRDLILGDDDLEPALIGYSSERVEDIAKEFSNDCKELRDIIDSFSKGKFTLSTEEVRGALSNLPTSFSIRLRGKTLSQSNSDHLFALWSFLHEVGFLNPRVIDDRQDKGFRHILHGEDPYFVSPSRWNEMQKVEWEVHPAFRSYLSKRKMDENSRIGFFRVK